MANKTYYERGDTFVDTSDKPAIIKRGNELTFTDDFKAGGGADLAPATASTLGGVKVGNGLNVASDGTLSVAGADYSITEHLTGRKWIDGLDIYEKSIELSNLTITANTAFDVIASTGIAKLLSGWLYTTGENGGGCLDVWVSSDIVKGKSQSTFSSGTVIVTLQYTKTPVEDTTNNRTVKKTSKKG